MDDGELIIGFIAGIVGGVVAGMTVPEAKKPGWVKRAGSWVEGKWQKYDEHKVILEEQKDEWIASHKERMRKKKEGNS